MKQSEWTSVIGEGLHTGFRKGTDHPDAMKAWDYINEMDPELWNGALSFLVWGLGIMGLIEVESEEGEE